MAAALAFAQLPPASVLEAFFTALIGGLLPALIWLWFWMHEGHEHHEPKQTLWFTFIVGMIAVPIVFPLQQWSAAVIGGGTGNFWVLVSWASFEEILKFATAYFIAFRNRDIFDEPIDAFVYLMTAALGFSAMENTFYLLGPLLDGNTINSILTGNMRFMGANLLHVASSGVLSLFIARAFFKSVWPRRFWALAGLVAAVAIHTLFNFIIILITEDSSSSIFVAFSLVWVTIIFLILALEKVKTVKDF